MPIDTKHPQYVTYQNDWLDCRQVSEGQRAVKEAGVRHLPRLTGQTDEEYAAYKMRALFYSITSKTLSALVGMALDEPPSLTYPEKMASYFEDDSGTQFYELFGTAVQELCLTSRFGVLVDRPAGGGDPYFTMYPTECIINWRLSADKRYEMVVLMENILVQDTTDEYLQVVKTRYRKLEIVDGRLQIITYLTGEQAGVFDQGLPTTITNTGIEMDYIPFVCATPNGLEVTPTKPLMIDIVNVNLSHYRTSADLEHGRHFTGLPTPWITGAESTSMHIGSTKAWVIPNHQAKVGYLEFTGQGLQSLENALKEKQGQLASMSARLIDNSSKGSEAAETVRLRYMSETASLKTVVRSVQALLNRAYTIAKEMQGLSGELLISLNMDFLDGKLTAAELKALSEAYLSGSLSKEIYIFNLKKGKALPPPGEDMGVIPDPPPREPAKPADPSNKPVQ